MVVACDLCSASFASRNQCFAHLQQMHGIDRSSKGTSNQPQTHLPVRAEKTTCKSKKEKRRVSSEPYIVCPSGCWYVPVPMAPPAAKLLLPGEIRQSWVEPCSMRVSASDLAAGVVLRRAVKRAVGCADSVLWLQSQPNLPERCHVITSLPDIGEMKLAPAEYETWFSAVVETIIRKLSSSSVAILYQTDGRHGGADGGWLDKGFLATLGARAAGATLVWHRIVNASRPAQLRSGRPGFARLLCFSKKHRCTAAGVDVLPQRGHMNYTGAAGEAACSAAVQYVMYAHACKPEHVAAARRRCAASCSSESESDPALPLLPEAHEDAPALVLDPFCGHGTVLALANAWGLDAIGFDTNRKRCEVASERRPFPEEHVFNDSGVQMGRIRYWAPAPEQPACSRRKSQRPTDQQS